jgi:anti-sigma regulatory factor (Ser/Thr protein kinase)
VVQWCACGDQWFPPNGGLELADDPVEVGGGPGVKVREADRFALLRVGGEVDHVALLWDAGDVLGAIELEELWTQLGRELPFSLLCGYRSTSVSGPEHAEALQHICQLHSSVLQAPHAEGQAGDHSGPSATEVSRRFPAERDAPRAARGFVADAMRRWGHSGTLLQDSVLVVSELATNAVVHARSAFSVVARREGSGVRLSVHDLSTAKPVLRSAPLLAPSGRGLQLVADITNDWGVETTSAGKTVWAELRA